MRIKKNLSKFLKIIPGKQFFQIPDRIYFGRTFADIPDNSISIFPLQYTCFGCGLSGLIAVKYKPISKKNVDVAGLKQIIEKITAQGYAAVIDAGLSLDNHFLGGQPAINALSQQMRDLKKPDLFKIIFNDNQIQTELKALADQTAKIIIRENSVLELQMGFLNAETVKLISNRLESLKDINWCLSTEILANLEKIKTLAHKADSTLSSAAITIFKKINAVFNSIDRLEVRGRDSAGISLLFILAGKEYSKFQQALAENNLADKLADRLNLGTLVNQGISIHTSKAKDNSETTAITITYKVAAEIGRLGDNISFLRKQVQNDPILQILVDFPNLYHTIFSHTRWASVGAITEPNCHPVDNSLEGKSPSENGIIHACLNGDIDNYLELKKKFEKNNCSIPVTISTDTKIIPLQIETYIQKGFDIAEAFRLAVNDFEGSHAIAMHTDLAPGKFFLAQKGSGQAVFIGLAPDHYMPASEVYGFIEETSFFLKLDGEKVVEGKNGSTQGQIFILDQDSKGGLDGIQAMYYDKTPIELTKKDIKRTEITSRDIDRQDFPHYFLKEISEAPDSVAKTLQNRWKIKDPATRQYMIQLDENTFPASLADILSGNDAGSPPIKRIFFMGQGTAGVAALACSNILNYYLNNPEIQVCAMKASELSGFSLNETDHKDAMADSLIIAISQSGTTTDTNRTVDMVKARGAHTLAIVNRRDADLTFKVDGVIYTSSGRDIEMSVASTNAFYSQIIAGAITGLKIAELTKRRSAQFISDEIKDLLAIPAQMRTVLATKEKIKLSAECLSATKIYWAAVGSGPNKASADEIRIKLSELCYKTISSDFVEDKKHIDLSSEPLIIVCAAGTKETVIRDIIKDTAIFNAHKATVLVIADEGENRFEPYAKDIFHVPAISEHLAPILNTLVGHIWGYYAALAINAGSSFLYNFQQDLKTSLDQYAAKNLDIYEVILEKSFREKIALFYNEFRLKKKEIKLPSAIALASDLTLLCKYLAGKLPVADFELDFGKKGTALNMLNTFFEYLGKSINAMSRPVDAIKHQAKTVTVGTSRISGKVEGILFSALEEYGIRISQLINRNIIVMKNLQGIIAEIKGAILYRIEGLNFLGEPNGKTSIKLIKKTGVLAPLKSRVETDFTLKGTKRIIIQKGNVYIGKGRKDGRSIIVIPAISNAPVGPGNIEYLLLLNIEFKDQISLNIKIKALGGKYEHIKNIVQENNVKWQESYLELIDMDQLFGKSAEKISECIIDKLKNGAET